MLVGNKSDLPDRQITREQGEALSAEYGFKHFHETSAKTGGNVSEGKLAFFYAVLCVIRE